LDPDRIALRASIASDRDFLFELNRTTHHDYVVSTWGAWSEQWQQKYFDENFDPIRIQIIQYDDTDIGQLRLHITKEELFLAAFAILPDFQNKGIGTYLITQLITEARLLRLPIRLRVLKVNPARKFYSKLGFKVYDQTDTHYLMSVE